MTGSAGNDIFKFSPGDSTTGSAAPTDSSFDIIKDWTAGSNSIDHTGGAIVVGGNSSAAIAGDASINSQGLASFDSDDDTLAERLSATEADLTLENGAEAREFAYFEHAANTYIFISDGISNVTADDLFIQLEGITNLTTTSLTAGDLFIS